MPESRKFSLKEVVAISTIFTGVSGFGGATTAMTAIESTQAELRTENAKLAVRVTRNESDLKDMRTVVNDLRSIAAEMKAALNYVKKQ